MTVLSLSIQVRIVNEYTSAAPSGNLATQLLLMNIQAQHRRFVVKQVFGTTNGSKPRKLLDNLKQLKQFEGLFSNAHQFALCPCYVALKASISFR